MTKQNEGIADKALPLKSRIFIKKRGKNRGNQREKQGKTGTNMEIIKSGKIGKIEKNR